MTNEASEVKDADGNDHMDSSMKDMMDYEPTDDVSFKRNERSERSQRRRYVVTAEESGFKNFTYHPAGVMLYSPPRQRQRWGETQSLPLIDWGRYELNW